jgi:thiamine biosynthesis protein ThiS
MVIEYNGKICHQEKWPIIKLKKNDKIELITIVGGG